MDDSRDGNDAAREERRRELEGNAKELAIRAVNFDQTGQLEAAIYYYRVSLNTAYQLTFVA